MTHTLTKAITALTLAVASFLPANAQDAFFVYRNDGQFNAFFNDEIDSIVCSNIDLDSIVHEEFVVQEFHTPDSIYRIPIASIDSVGFQKLPTVYKDNVVSLDHDLWKHIKSVDTTAIHISLTTPKSLIPEAGMKVVSLQTCDFFPYGFSGKIESINETDSCYTLICEWIDPIEVLDRYYCVQTIGTNILPYTRGTGEARKLPAIKIDLSQPDINVETNSNWAFNVGTRFEYEIEIEPTLNIIHNIYDGQNRFVTGKINTITETSIGASVYGNLKWSPDLEKFEKDIIPPRPIPYVPFISYYAKFVPSISFSGEMAVGFRYNKSFEKTYGFSWSTDRNIRNGISPLGDTEIINEGVLVDNFVGSVELDANCGIEFGLCFFRDNKIFDAKLFIKPELGINIEANINLSIPVLERETKKKTAKYELVKGTDNGISSNFYIDVVGGYEVSFLDLDKKPVWGLEGTPIEISLFEHPLLEKELFPTFENVEFDKENFSLSCDIKDDLIMPTQVGFKIYDENGNELFKELYTGGDYYNSKSFNHYYITLSDITKLVNRQCTAYPYLTFMGYDIPASPYIEIGIGLFPITDDASGIKYNKAVLNGHIQNEDNLPFNGNVGFLFGTNADPKSFGTKFTSQYNTNAVFSHHLSSLESETTYYYCTFLELGDTCYYGKTVSFTTPEKPEMDEEVDLGLSVNWRGWNVGATKPEEYGNYFAWGETSQKEYYAWQSYFENPYDENNEWIGSATTTDVAGTDKDAATVILGEKWRMPTYEEVKELMEKCSWTWSDYNGVKGYTVESNVAGYEGNFIFLPAAGNYDKTSIKQEGSYGGYWSSTPLDSESKSAAYIFYFYGETIHSTQSSNRYTGRTIRPVTPKEYQ